MRDAVGSRSYPQGTESYLEYEETYVYLPEEESESSLLAKVGQAAMIVSGAALVALAAKRAWPSSNPQVQRLTERTSEALAAAPIETAVTINKPKAELYAFWRRFENLPQFMRHVEEVVDQGDGRSHWVGKSPLGFKVEWDAEILEEREGEHISWSSLPGSQIHNAGTVRFEDAPQGRGTVVRAIMEVGSVNPVGQA
ncbi:MAG TPA: SRPBCC family protein, partial [Thermoanaerobaculia bacterium]|nr:SRPBCC family protein [Thermoanaerobaculia bacterium]